MAQHLGLGELGQRRGRGTAHPCRNECVEVADQTGDVSLGSSKDDPPASRGAELHHERLVPDGRVVAAERHATASATAAASRSRSACVCTSVTQ